MENPESRREGAVETCAAIRSAATDALALIRWRLHEGDPRDVDWAVVGDRLAAALFPDAPERRPTAEAAERVKSFVNELRIPSDPA